MISRLVSREGWAPGIHQNLLAALLRREARLAHSGGLACSASRSYTAAPSPGAAREEIEDRHDLVRDALRGRSRTQERAGYGDGEGEMQGKRRREWIG